MASAATASIVTATTTTPGCYPYNQDRVATFTTDTTTTLVVADGHGPQPSGELFAEWSVRCVAENPTLPFPELFALTEATCRERFRHSLRLKPVREHDGAFYDPSPAAARGGHLLPHRGGTTLTVVRIDHTTGGLSVANVGDSEARYFEFTVAAPTEPVDEDAMSDSPSPSPTFTCLDVEGTSITADHAPTCAAEYERALRDASPGASPPRFVFDTPPSHSPPGAVERPVFVRDTEGQLCLNPAGGYAAATVRGDWGAYIVAGDGRERIAFTRAIGDFNMKRYGVSAEPTVAGDIPPPPAGTIRVVVVASDGMWDACHYREVAEAIQKSLGAGVSAVARELRHLAEYCSTERFGEVHDNISIAVAVIRGPASDRT